MAIKPGQKAPDFILYNSEKKQVSLNDFKGKKNVLLLFFPMAFTSTCTKELCTVRDDIGNYNNIQAEVLGISVDSVFTLAKFKQEQQLNYQLLSDFNKKTSQDYESIYSSFTEMDMHGVSKRSAFIINREGIIEYTEVLENATDIPDLAAIKNKMADLT